MVVLQLDNNLNAHLQLSNGIDVQTFRWQFNNEDDANFWTTDALVVLAMKGFVRIE